MSTEWFSHQPTWIRFFKFLYPYVYLDYDAHVARELLVKPKLLEVFVGTNEELLILLRTFTGNTYRFIMVEGLVSNPVCLLYSTYATSDELSKLDTFVMNKFKEFWKSKRPSSPSNTVLERRLREELSRTSLEYLTFIRQVETKSFVDEKYRPAQEQSRRPAYKPEETKKAPATAPRLGKIHLESKTRGTFDYWNGSREVRGIRFSYVLRSKTAEVQNEERPDRIHERQFEQFLPDLDKRVFQASKSGMSEF